MVYITTQFTLGMLDPSVGNSFDIYCDRVSKERVINLINGGLESRIQHPEMVEAIKYDLGVEVPLEVSPTAVKLEHDDTLIVVHYRGPRIVEGLKPIGVFTYYLMRVNGAVE